MTRHNYRQAKRNREDTRKKRQLEKRERKLSRVDPAAPSPEVPADGASSEPKASP